MGEAMKPRSRAGGEAPKARGRKALKTKRRDASKRAFSSAPTVIFEGRAFCEAIGAQGSAHYASRGNSDRVPSARGALLARPSPDGPPYDPTS